MKANSIFLNLPREFWAYVRLVGQEAGYAVRNKNEIKVPTFDEMSACLRRLNLNSLHVFNKKSEPTELGLRLFEYFQYRANVLEKNVEPKLMDAKKAKREFEILHKKLSPSCPIPMNKQKGIKKAAAYLTGIANMLIEANAEGHSCDYDPRVLTTATRNGAPVYTFARRVDGAFPGAINPIAIWEIKEYYYTTTFGSRVADGIYETLLDGMEIEALRKHNGIEIYHYLMVDAHYTWWECGKSYLCRIIDMLHMGYVDEVLFGYEVIERLPVLVKQWVKKANNL